MNVIAYARNGDLREFVARLAGEYPDAQIIPRNASAHVPGQLEPADLVVVDDRFPAIADEYESAGTRSLVVDGTEPSAQPEPLPDAVHEALLDLTVSEMKETLPGIENVDRLRDVLEQETRVTARSAIEDRIQELEG